MEYRAVSGRCAVDLSALPVPPREAMAIFGACGFVELQVDMVELPEAVSGSRSTGAVPGSMKRQACSIAPVSTTVFSRTRWASGKPRRYHSAAPDMGTPSKMT
jgi:hypothetical protein